MMEFRVHDWATDFAKKRTAAASRAHAGALASAGFRLRARLKTGMRQQAPGDIIWPRASPWIQYGSSLLARARQVQYRAERRKRGPKMPEQPLGTGRERIPLGRLAAGARYQKIQAGDTIRVLVGFLNARLAKLAAYHTEAHAVPVTAKMRRLIFAVGLGIRKGTIQIPARPAVGPVYRQNQARIAGFCRQRTEAAWRGEDPQKIQPPF
jgi:hypothetical protein